MTRRIKRQPEFEINLQIKDEAFIRPPREAQRNWLLNKALTEFANNLTHLHRLAATFVAGKDGFSLPHQTTEEVRLADDDIMEDWQIPIMRAMSEVSARPDRELLEIGFGRGISAEFVQEKGVRSHTIVECEASVIERYHAWRGRYPERDIRLIEGLWQETTDQFGLYDAIFFHTYALDEDEYWANAVQSVTFAEHFFPTAVAHLKPGGVFTYLTNEIDSLGRDHQRLLFDHFSSFGIRKVEPLNLPQNVQDTWWADSMIVIEAIK